MAGSQSKSLIEPTLIQTAADWKGYQALAPGSWLVEGPDLAWVLELLPLVIL